MEANHIDSSHKLGVALIGCGRIGKVHLRHLVRNPRISLKWIVDLDSSICEAAMKNEHIEGATCRVTTFDNLEDVLSDSSVHIAVICTPTDTHTTLITASLNKGKGVFCEKPVSVNVEEIAECYALAAAVKKPLLVGFNRRFDYPVKQLHEEVMSNKIGDIQTIRGVFRDHPGAPTEFIKAQSEGGKGITLFHDIAIHDVDMVLWLMKDELPTAVSAQGMAKDPVLREIGQIDVAVTTMTFQSGAIAILDTGYRSGHGYDVRAEVIGSKGVVTAGNPSPTAVTVLTSDGSCGEKLAYSFPERYPQSYSDEMDHLIDAMIGKSEISITGSHCIKVCQVVNAMRKSYVEGKTIDPR